MIDTGYLVTSPGILTCCSCLLNFLTLVCVIVSDANATIHGGFMTAVAVLGLLFCLVIIACHVVKTLAVKIPPYPFALFQVISGIIMALLYICTTTFLLTEYSHIPVLVASAVFSYLSGFMHLGQSMFLVRAIKVTRIAREAINFGNSITSTSTEEHAAKVAYVKEKEDVVMDPMQSVY